MFFTYRALASSFLFFIGACSAFAQDGSMIIRGTELQVSTNSVRDTVTFSNDCGKQTMPRAEVLRGAIPNDIVPCPRTGASTATTPSDVTGVPETTWGAVAVGVEGLRVNSGISTGRSSEEEAQSAALDFCSNSGNESCQIVGTFSNCGYVSISERGSDPSWGIGPTPRAAQNACQSGVTTGYCRPAIGGCNTQ